MTASWGDSPRGYFTGIDWQYHMKGSRALDPYLIWADVSGPAGFGRLMDGVDKWPLIVELSDTYLKAYDPHPAKGAKSEVPWVFACMEVAGAYKADFSESVSAYGDTPGTLRIDGKYITANVSPGQIEHLLCSPHIVRFQLGMPRIPRYFDGPFTPPTVQAGVQPKKVVVGIIDDGCAFANPAFEYADGTTRVEYLWDQDASRKPDHYWKEPQGFGYGAEIVKRKLDEVKAASVSNPLSAFEVIRYGSFKLDPETKSSQPTAADGTTLPQMTQLAGTHGTSVMDLAAGYPSPLRFPLVPLREDSTTWKPRVLKEIEKAAIVERIAAIDVQQMDEAARTNAILEVDAADQWPIVFVQLPTATVADTSGGSLAVHVLDAVRYIIRRARAIGPKMDEDYDQNRVIINVSWGSLAGAHDGTSILECALKERVLEDSVVTWVVLAAGNAHRKKHFASLGISPGQERNLFWVVGPDNPLESYLEIWLPTRDVNGALISDRLQRELIVSVFTPDSDRLAKACLGDLMLLRRKVSTRQPVPDTENSPPSSIVGALVFSRRVVQSEEGTMVLIALAPTRATMSRHSAPHGTWQIGLAWGMDGATAGPEVRINAWCERSDLLYGGYRPQQSTVYSEEQPVPLSEHEADSKVAFDQSAFGSVPSAVRPVSSLSSLAGIPPVPRDVDFVNPSDRNSKKGRIMVAGAYRLSDFEMSLDSSGGPGRHVSDTSVWMALRGLDSAAMRVRPDVDAPSELANAVPGLRTTGTLPGRTTRIGGTSAAAALVTRALANILYWSDLAQNNEKFLTAMRKLFMVERNVQEGISGARTTLTPKNDDAFRRGEKRLY